MNEKRFDIEAEWVYQYGLTPKQKLRVKIVEVVNEYTIIVEAVDGSRGNESRATLLAHYKYVEES